MMEKDVRHRWEQARADCRRGVRALRSYLTPVQARSGRHWRRFAGEIRAGAANLWCELCRQIGDLGSRDD